MYQKNDISQEIFSYVTPKEHGKLSLCICSMNDHFTKEEIDCNFAKEEVEIYEKLNSLKRKKEFLYGRLMAKKAVIELQEDKKIPLSNIRITRGVFCNPIIKGEMNKYAVSISHCKKYAAAITFPEELLVGLDIEFLDSNLLKSLALCVCEGEEELRPDTMNQEVFQYVLWTCKEALAKSIRLGLTMNYEMLKVASLKKHQTGFEATFSNFPGLKAYTKKSNDYIYSIVYPYSIEITQFFS